MTAAADLHKPLDLGNGAVAASFGRDGGWLSVGWPDPVHGFLELTGAPRFDEQWRTDPAAVRRYRNALTRDEHAFLRLVLPDEDASARRAGLDGDGRPAWRRTGDRSRCTATAWARPGRRVLVQRYEIVSDRPAVLEFRGRLDRCSLAEITEVDPLPPVVPSTRLQTCGAMLLLTDPALSAQATVRVVSATAASRWRPYGGSGRGPAARMFLTPGRATRYTVMVIVSVGTHDDPLDPQPSAPVEGSLAPPRLEQGTLLPTTRQGAAHHPDGSARSGAVVSAVLGSTSHPAVDRITRGALRYTLECTALDVGCGDRVILTDHRLLPLSWTRDAYYQARLLLEAAATEPGASSSQRLRDVVAAHLRWLWRRSWDSADGWLRSHLPRGRVKDRVRQADQQLYPLLELADFRSVTGTWPDPREPGVQPAQAWGRKVAAAWARLPRRGRYELLATDENPADERAQLPYLLSTQILYWHTASRLARWSAELGIDHLALSALAERLVVAVDQCFSTDGPAGPQLAYESDGAQVRCYHDANDLPTALAPWWGFCPPEHPRWLATLRYAFSPGNPAYVPGRYGGLGSVHTPGTWTLGDVQEWAVAIVCGETTRCDAVLDRLDRVAGVDGLLPETYDPHTAEWVARHWFAWPGAAVGMLALAMHRPEAQ